MNWNKNVSPTVELNARLYILIDDIRDIQKRAQEVMQQKKGGNLEIYDDLELLKKHIEDILQKL